MNKWRENPRRIRFHICRTQTGKQNVIKIGVSMFESRIASIIVELSVTLLIEFLFLLSFFLFSKNIHPAFRASKIIAVFPSSRRFESTKNREIRLRHNYTQLYWKIEFDVTSTGRGDLLFNRRK